MEDNITNTVEDIAKKDALTCFKDLYHIDVGDHIEKKKDLSYLSWPYAVAEVAKRFPDFSYRILTFGEKGLPYMFDEKTGYMVWTEVTIQGITRVMWLPVMDSSNKSMKDVPYTYKTKYGENVVEAATMFDINKTIMRCLVKNFAMFGLGLYIYAGEDLPEESDEEKERKEKERLLKEEQKKQREKEISIVLDNIQSVVSKVMENGVNRDSVAEAIKKHCIVNGKPSPNYTKVKDLDMAKKILEEVEKLITVNE